jgi:hypothetical protein
MEMVLTIVRRGNIENPSDILVLWYASLPYGAKKEVACAMYPEKSVEAAKSELSKRINSASLTLNESVKLMLLAGVIPVMKEYLEKIEGEKK